MKTKIVALVDALGNPARFILLPGQHHDSVGVEPLLDDVETGALIRDKGFDSDWLRREFDQRGALAVIPPKTDRKMDIRYDKTDQSFAANIHLVAIATALK